MAIYPQNGGRNIIFSHRGPEKVYHSPEPHIYAYNPFRRLGCSELQEPQKRT